MLRSVETVKIAFLISVISLLVNGGINYILIFGRFGAPEMGIRGAAIGTFAARILELGIVLFYVWKKTQRSNCLMKNSGMVLSEKAVVLSGKPFKVCIPILTSGLLWAVSFLCRQRYWGIFLRMRLQPIPYQAPFSVSEGNRHCDSRCFCCCDRKDIGSNDEEKVRCNGRTLSVLYLAIGLLLGTVLFLLRSPLLSMYRLTLRLLYMQTTL